MEAIVEISGLTDCDPEIISGHDLVFTKDGRYERSIEMPHLFAPLKVVVLPTGELFVLGYGWRPGPGHRGSDMILKLSPTGAVLTSFSPLPVYPDKDVLWGVQINYLLLDDAGRLIHVLADGTMRVFDLEGRLVKTMSPILPVGEYLHGVSFRDGVFLFSITDPPNQQSYLAVVSADGEALSTTDVTANPWIGVEGRDGYYYTIGSAGPLVPGRLPKLRIRKMKLDLSK